MASTGLGLCEDAQALSHPAPVKKRPSLPSSFFKFPARSRLKVIQQYISSFDYKRSPQTSFNSHKSRPLARIMDTAKMIIYNPQPIKCVEAVFLALFLTAGILDAERLPLSFKSQLQGQMHQHIVLLVKYNNKYGAFGISRQHNLMSKEFEFESISSIVDEFRKAYEQYEHKVLQIRIGLPVEHNAESFNFVCWRHLSLDPSSLSWEKCFEALEWHMNHAKRLWERWLLDGQRENIRADPFLKNLDTKPSVEERLEVNPTVEAVKRRQEPDKQEPDFEVVKRRQPYIANQPSVTTKVKASPLWKTSPRPISIAHKKNTKRKIALKCCSMELFPAFCSRLENKKPKMNQANRDLKRANWSLRKLEVLNVSPQPSRKSSTLQQKSWCI